MIQLTKPNVIQFEPNQMINKDTILREKPKEMRSFFNAFMKWGEKIDY